ncbi:MAG: hypothetical protein C6W56_05330 [Caldibacillus debilis]|nr:MAG: hypothetical protein C6W56_05330 [Caldibacillus debilis]
MMDICPAIMDVLSGMTVIFSFMPDKFFPLLNVSVKMKNKRLKMADRPMGCRTTISRCRNPSLWDYAFFSMPHFPTLKNGHTGPMRNNIRPIMPKTCPGHPIGPSHEEGFAGSGPDKRTRRPSREIPDGPNGTGRDWNREIIPTRHRKPGKMENPESSQRY